MVRLFILKALLFVLLCFSLGYAQDHVVLAFHGPRGTLDHDYFDQSSEARQLLYLVETAHLNPCPHNPRGVFGDIAMGKYQYAIADLIYTLDRFVNHPKALQLMGSLAELTNGPSLAIPYYQRALKLYPQYALTHAQFGVYLVDTGHINSGTAELKKAIEINPNLAIAYAWLASAYSRNGNLESARQAAERARALGYRGKIAGQDLAE